MECYEETGYKSFDFLRGKEKKWEAESHCLEGGQEEKEDAMLNRLVQKARGKKERLCLGDCVCMITTSFVQLKSYRA